MVRIRSNFFFKHHSIDLITSQGNPVHAKKHRTKFHPKEYKIFPYNPTKHLHTQQIPNSIRSQKQIPAFYVQ